MSLSDLPTRELFMEASDSALAGAIMGDNESQRSYAAALLQIARVLVVRLALDSQHEASIEEDAALREVRAKAWDEGFNAGELDAMSHETFDEPCITNPYREESGD